MSIGEAARAALKNNSKDERKRAAAAGPCARTAARVLRQKGGKRPRECSAAKNIQRNSKNALTKQKGFDNIIKRSETERCRGGVAHLGERLNGIQEVRGSIPLISTTEKPILQKRGRLSFLFRTGRRNSFAIGPVWEPQWPHRERRGLYGALRGSLFRKTGFAARTRPGWQSGRRGSGLCALFLAFLRTFCRAAAIYWL